RASCSSCTTARVTNPSKDMRTTSLGKAACPGASPERGFSCPSEKVRGRWCLRYMERGAWSTREKAAAVGSFVPLFHDVDPDAHQNHAHGDKHRHRFRHLPPSPAVDGDALQHLHP